MINLEPYEQKYFSQNGEDGITLKLVELIYNNDNHDKFYIEFGVENGNECNTVYFKRKNLIGVDYKWMVQMKILQ
jgi:hypothetical protein